MSELNKRLLDRLRRDIMLGRKMDDLSITIESRGDEAGTAEAEIETRPEGDRGQREIVSQPVEKMLCNLRARSPHDVWTITYKGRTVAQGEFAQIGEVLTVIPKQTLPYRYLLARQIVMWVGAVVILSLSFFAGLLAARNIPPALAGRIDRIASDAAGCITGVTTVKTSLDEIARRQDVLKTLLVSAFAQLKDAGERPAPVSAGQAAAGAASEADQISERMRRELAEQDINELLELERRKKGLLYQDLELANRGLLETHPERQAVARSVRAIDEKAGGIKEKYGLSDKQRQ